MHSIQQLEAYFRKSITNFLSIGYGISAFYGFFLFAPVESKAVIPNSISGEHRNLIGCPFYTIQKKPRDTYISSPDFPEFLLIPHNYRI
jgi:hypothetical protein